MSLKHLSRRGDTIVEVMIVLTVLGLALSISYATANASLLDARQAQESSQASELVDSQLESLRTMASNPSTSSNYIFNSTPFCVTGGSNVTLPPAPPAANPCLINSLYTISIQYTANVSNPPGVVGGKFAIKASWPDVEGHGTDTDTLNYRYYHP